MHIDRIILRDVGPFKDVMIELLPGRDPRLADAYILTGPNGSGKTTVLYALGALITAGNNDLGAVSAHVGLQRCAHVELQQRPAQ